MNRSKLIAAILTAAGVSVAHGQGASIEEVVVTATKREQSVQDVPISISAFTGDEIEAAGVKDIRDIAGQTPGLQIRSRGETEGAVFIRGIGSVAPGIGADPAVGIYIDGLYAARGTNATAAFFDVERVEVVKGPQGTLFGRNASSGAISIITRKPELGENYGRAMVGIGDEDQQKYEFIYNAAIGDTSAIRVGVKHDHRDGLYENALTGDELNARKHTNARIAYKFDGGGQYRTFLSVEYTHFNNNAAFAGPNNSFDSELAQNPNPADQRLESWRVNWTNEWDFNDKLSLTSITGYYTHDVNVTPVDADLIDLFVADFEEPQDNDYFSQEFRLNGSSDTLDWFVGASYAREELSFRNSLRYDEFVVAALFGLDGLDVGNGMICDGGLDLDGSGDFAVPICQSPAIETPSGDGVTESWAVFADVTWHINEQFDLNLGLRYTHDDKKLDYNNPPTAGLLAALDGQIFGPLTPGEVSAKDSFESVDPRVALNWMPNDDVLVYASFAMGYKSGGLNRQFDPVSGGILPFDKERNMAYEIGFKATLFNGRGQLNAAMFYNEYEDFQLERLLNLVPQVDNIGDVDVFGGEADFRFLVTDNFELFGSISLLDTEVENAVDPALEGNTAVLAADVSGALGGRWSMPYAGGEFKAQAVWTYTDDFYFDIENTLEQDAYSTVDARIGWNNDRFGVALIGENLADEEYLAEAFNFLDVTTLRGWGRLLRAEVTFNF